MTPTTPSDTELLRLMMAKDEQAFAALYQRHHAPVYRFALLMSGRTNIAEEVTQEVFLLLIREPQRYDETRGSLPAYLYGVARYHVLRFLRRERPYIPLVPESNEGSVAPGFIAKDDPFGDCRRKEVIRLVRQAVLALPERYREVVVLCDFQELSGVDAAAALGCPIGTVNSRLHRGHALLIKKLRAAGKFESTSLDTQVMRSFA